MNWYDGDDSDELNVKEKMNIILMFMMIIKLYGWINSLVVFRESSSLVVLRTSRYNLDVYVGYK